MRPTPCDCARRRRGGVSPPCGAGCACPRLLAAHLRERRHVRREMRDRVGAADRGDHVVGVEEVHRDRLGACRFERCRGSFARHRAPRAPPRAARATVGRPTTPVAPVTKHRQFSHVTPPASTRCPSPSPVGDASGSRLRTRSAIVTASQLGAPRCVGLVHHHMDRARDPVLTRRAGRSAPGAGSRCRGTRLAAVDRLDHVEHGDLVGRARRAGTRRRARHRLEDAGPAERLQVLGEIRRCDPVVLGQTSRRQGCGPARRARAGPCSGSPTPRPPEPHIPDTNYPGYRHQVQVSDAGPPAAPAPTDRCGPSSSWRSHMARPTPVSSARLCASSATHSPTGVGTGGC